jgi:hypothetical protein
MTMCPLLDSPWYTTPEWWIAIFAIPTLLAIIYQAREMARATKEMRASTKEVKRQADILERQTAATEAAAKAALLNARAVIAAERPWIVVNPQKTTSDKFVFHVVNKGRTPARIESVAWDHSFDSYHDSSRKPPTYSVKFYSPRNLLEQNADFSIPLINHPDAMIRGMNPKNQFLIFDGKVTYWDAFEEGGANHVPHETIWCYYYDAGRRDFVRIEEYNRFT